MKSTGFTLVEMLTSSAILAIAVVSVVAVVRTGRDLEISDLHRRRARAILDSVFEDSAYHYRNYAALPPIPAVPGSSVVIDMRDAGTADDLPGTLWVDTSIHTTPVEHKKLVASVRWREPEMMDTIRLVKLVAEVE